MVLRDIASVGHHRASCSRTSPGARTGCGKRRDTGRIWPVVKGTLQEPAWSQVNGETGAGACTRL